MGDPTGMIHLAISALCYRIKEQETDMKRIVLTVGLLLLLTIPGIVDWYVSTPLLLNRAAEEAPARVGFLASTGKAAVQFSADDEIGVILPPTPVVTAGITEGIIEGITAQPTATVTEIVTKTFTVETPDNTSGLLAQGSFVDGDTIHKGTGVATLYKTPDGGHLLRFDDFATASGLDLHVLLSPAATPTNPTHLGNYLDLGALQENLGDQNYTLPADFDPTLYKSVIIYCVPFQVIFTTATLE